MQRHRMVNFWPGDKDGLVGPHIDNRSKPGSLCFTCKHGRLELSPSGRYLICPKCGNVVAGAERNEAGDTCLTCGHGILEQSPSAKYLICRKCGRLFDAQIPHGGAATLMVAIRMDCAKTVQTCILLALKTPKRV
jgi:ribosomal protein S27E